MVADSVLGSAWQGRFRCPACDVASEWRVHRCGAPTVRQGGMPWLDNDGVNLAATALAAPGSRRAAWLLPGRADPGARRLQRRSDGAGPLPARRAGRHRGRAAEAPAAAPRRWSAPGARSSSSRSRATCRPGPPPGGSTPRHLPADQGDRVARRGLPPDHRARLHLDRQLRTRSRSASSAAAPSPSSSPSPASRPTVSCSMASSTNATPEVRTGVTFSSSAPAPAAAPPPSCSHAPAVRVAVVDRAAFPRDKACSEYMSPEAVRLLDRLGVVPALEAAGAAPLHGTAVIAARGSRLHGRFARAGYRPFRPTGLSVSRRTARPWRWSTAARQAGVRRCSSAPRWRSCCTTAAPSPAPWSGTADGSAPRAPGAAHDRGRRPALGRRPAARSGPAGHGRAGSRSWPTWTASTGIGDSAEMHVGRRGYVGLNPIGGGRTNVALVVPAARGGEARGRAEAFFLETLAEFPAVRDRVVAGTLARRVLATGPFAAVVRAGRGRRRGAGRRRRRLLRPVHRRRDLQRAPRRRAPGRGRARRSSGTGPVAAARLAAYRRARRRAFAGKWAVERLIGYGMLFPALFDRAVDAARPPRAAWPTR